MDPKASPSSSKNPKINLVVEEINRGKKYSRSLEQRQPGLKTIFEEAPDQQLYPDVYVEKCIVPDYTPNYSDCRHERQTVINRDVLNMNQHIDLLAQPRFVRPRKVEKPYIVKRKVPGPSHRILELARPKKRQALETCNQYGATMEKFCIENCHRNVQDVTFVPVNDAVYFIKLNQRKPLIERQKLKLRMKRLQERINEVKMAKMQNMLRTLYASLKERLLAPSPLAPSVKDEQTILLSDVIRSKLETLLHRTVTVEQANQATYLDRLVVQISDNLADWMMELVKSLEEVGGGIVTVENTTVVTNTTVVATGVTNITVVTGGAATVATTGSVTI